jgi:hypothetical protein
MADIIEIFADTGQVIERDFTPEELAQRQADEAEALATQAAAEAASAERASARAALLSRLGITEDEAALLGGL